MTNSAETSKPATLRFVRINWKLFVRAPARMSDMISASTYRTSRPRVHDIEHEGGMNGDVGVEAGGWLPRAVPNAGYKLPACPGGMERDAAAVAEHDKARLDQAGNSDLQALDRGIHVANSRAARTFLAEHVPGLQSMAQLEMDAAL